MRRPRSQIISQCWLVIFLFQRVTALCYFPDASRPFLDQPCFVNGTQDSFCCGPGAICLSNKLCWDKTGGPWRGSCTDVTWKSPSCPQFCLGIKDGGASMTDCKNPDSDSWCCNPKGGGTCDCSEGNFTIPGVRSLVSTIPWPKSSTTSSTSPSSRAKASPSSSSSTSSTFASPSSDSQTQTSNLTTPQGTVIAAVTDTSKSNNTNIGAAVGVPVALISVAFIIALVWFLKRQRRTNAKLKELQEQMVVRETDRTSHLPDQPLYMPEMSATEGRPEMEARERHELPPSLAL